jgi:hypothetical protein
MSLTDKLKKKNLETPPTIEEVRNNLHSSEVVGKKTWP